jgi:hypothetical protein
MWMHLYKILKLLSAQTNSKFVMPLCSDYGYELVNGGCSPLAFITSIVCDGKEYEVPSGFRKHPLSSCEGGVALDKSNTKSCTTGLSGWSWFFIIFLVVVGLGTGLSAVKQYREQGFVHFVYVFWIHRSHSITL